VSAPIIAGAEPYSASGDRRGALVLHGFTGNPQSMRGLAVALADAGFSVEMPLLPGHGTAVEDMVPTRWKDWSHAAEQALAELASRTDAVVVVGLSMGGTLSVWLAEHHPEIAALSVVNPLLTPPDADTLGFIQAMIDGGDVVAPGIGSDIARDGAVETAYPGMPLAAALSLFEGVAEVEALLGSVACPVLLFTSVQDHVVDPGSSTLLVERAKGPVEQVLLERSYHVATLDYDKDEIEARTVAFLTGVLASARP
jgi:carboxylesterase